MPPSHHIATEYTKKLTVFHSNNLEESINRKENKQAGTEIAFPRSLSCSPSNRLRQTSTSPSFPSCRPPFSAQSRVIAQILPASSCALWAARKSSYPFAPLGSSSRDGPRSPPSDPGARIPRHCPAISTTREKTESSQRRDCFVLGWE